jgi:hypothetical protein
LYFRKRNRQQKKLIISELSDLRHKRWIPSSLYLRSYQKVWKTVAGIICAAEESEG